MSGRLIPPRELLDIENAARRFADGASASQVWAGLTRPAPFRTLQYRLRRLVEAGRLWREGNGPFARYRVPNGRAAEVKADPLVARRRAALDDRVPLSEAGRAVQRDVSRSAARRPRLWYMPEILARYRPNETFYLPAAARAELAATAGPAPGAPGARTRRVVDRLTLDAAWNHSRLAGAAYTRIEARNLIDGGRPLKRREPRDAVLILNLVRAVEYLTGRDPRRGVEGRVIQNIHALATHGLIADPARGGRLRRTALALGHGLYQPTEDGRLIRAEFARLTAKAAAITDPFEQSFFVLAHVAYLQPFDHANHAVARLAAMLPLMRANCAPLTFEDVPRQVMNDAFEGFYDLGQTALLADVFLWTMRQSALRYAAPTQALGEPDPFRIRHAAAISALARRIVVGRLDQAATVTAWVRRHLATPADRRRFRTVMAAELAGLHAGNLAVHGIDPTDYAAWRRG